MSPNDSQWIARFGDLKVFRSSSGHSNVPSRYKDRQLARWVVKQRVAFRNGQLEDWKQERLATVNFELERKELDRRNKQYLTYGEAQSLVWRLGLTSLDEYFSWARGTLPKYGGFPENLPRSPQNVYRDNGWTNWNEFLGTSNPQVRTEENWDGMFLKYREHIAQHIDAPNYIKANTKLRNWVNTQRAWQRQGKLDPQRKKN